MKNKVWNLEAIWNIGVSFLLCRWALLSTFITGVMSKVRDIDSKCTLGFVSYTVSTYNPDHRFFFGAKMSQIGQIAHPTQRQARRQRQFTLIKTFRTNWGTKLDCILCNSFFRWLIVWYLIEPRGNFDQKNPCPEKTNWFIIKYSYARYKWHPNQISTIDMQVICA